MTYAQLDLESDRLATRLHAENVGAERCIGIFTERSTDFILAVLAVLKTGAAYVPLDPATPAGRASRIFSDAGVVALIAHSSTAAAVRGVGRPVIEIDRFSPPAELDFKPCDAQPDQLAYVIYTSGSTGAPKGVEITHRSLCNLIDWHQETFALRAADRGSQVAALGFDAAVWEIWPYLTAGASVHFADELTRRSAEMLRDWIVGQHITIAFAPTALAEQLFELKWPENTSLRILLTGGDTLYRRPPDGVPFSVINNYGPTECTVVATSGTVSPANNLAKPSIGWPIKNACALVLDENLRPVPAGAVGELYIGGEVVGRGYRNAPELTAGRFLNYGVASGGTLRVYRTGDLARTLDGGELEFVGRTDDQVKIRGFRIELGEIETSLNRFPKIAGSTVSVIDAVGGPAIAAYVVAVPNSRLTEDELRAYLAQNLPDYMVPSFFVALNALPLLANGKLDRSALPEPCAENTLSRAATQTQLDTLQAEVAKLVSTLMKRASVEPDDNLFFIGGHSMFGAQLVARIRDVFGVQLPLRDVFTGPTVRELSIKIARLTDLR